MSDELRETNPICPSCGLSCGVRRCKPERPDICCEDCPEQLLFARHEKARSDRAKHNQAIWDAKTAGEKHRAGWACVITAGTSHSVARK